MVRIPLEMSSVDPGEKKVHHKDWSLLQVWPGIDTPPLQLPSGTHSETIFHLLLARSPGSTTMLIEQVNILMYIIANNERNTFQIM